MTAIAKIPVYYDSGGILRLDAASRAHVTARRWQAPGHGACVPHTCRHISRRHDAIQNELGRLIANTLSDQGNPCTVITTPGMIPRVWSETNIRIPCSRRHMLRRRGGGAGPHKSGPARRDPFARQSGGSLAEVWTYTAIPSVKEILVPKMAVNGAELLRRAEDGSWPGKP